MPDYDYRCNACRHVFEKNQRITAPAGANCPQCDSADCTRLISGGTFHLKGSGWYASDYGAKKGPSDASDKRTSEEKAPTAAAAGDKAADSNGSSDKVVEKPVEKAAAADSPKAT